jgi:hypothetical protein
MVTGRPVAGSGGHRWTTNTDPLVGQTIHSNKGSYVASAWDVAHDNGLRTGLWASKTKFSLFDGSYDGDAASRQGGALDVTGVDNGRDKIDTYFYSEDSGAMTDMFVAQMTAQPYHYAMLHFHDPDSAGHDFGWMGTSYLDAVRAVDVQLGRILDMINADPRLAGQTAVILTADHGGTGTAHSANNVRQHYTVPFYVWGPGVDAGADLYTLNPATRANPLTGRPTTTTTPPPIRNGDVANLAMDFLGLASVPGSFFNASQSLAVTIVGQPPVPPPAAPANLTAAASSTSRSRINLSWSDRSNNEQGFVIEYSLDGQNWSALATVPANTRSYSARNLTRNTLYYFRVKATHSTLGDSMWSNVASARTRRW